MAEVFEYFDVLTEGGRRYLIQALNTAYAAHKIEYEFQERVTSVERVQYHKIVLVGDQLDAAKITPVQTADESSSESTGEDQAEGDVAEVPSPPGSEAASEEDVSN